MSNEHGRDVGVRHAKAGPLEGLGFDRQWCANEVAIDFPAIPAAVDRIRAMLLDDESARPLRAELSLTPREAFGGVTVPLDVPVRSACPLCGGRGESWMEPCRGCDGTGDSFFHHRVRLLVPAGVADGTRFRFKVTAPMAQTTRVEVHVAVR